MLGRPSHTIPARLEIRVSASAHWMGHLSELRQFSVGLSQSGCVVFIRHYVRRASFGQLVFDHSLSCIQQKSQACIKKIFTIYETAALIAP